MSKAVIAFIFDEPEDPIEFGRIVARAKEAFIGMEGVKIHAAINEAANTLVTFVQTGQEPEETSNLVKHAQRELALLDNDRDFNTSIINAIRGFVTYGHSGGSAPVAISILNELLQFHNLTPLTDDPSEWNEVGPGVWQSSRNSEAFSDNGGRTYRLVSEVDQGDVEIHHASRMWRPPSRNGDEPT